MKTILVDDELWAMSRFERECAKDPMFDVMGMFDQPTDALEYARHNRVDFALLDIEMQEINGLALGVMLRELHPDIIIIYVTAYSRYSLDAMKMKADYFILKPYNLEDVKDALQRAKLLSARQDKPIVIKTFGHFEVFVNGKPVYFSSAKAKELLAVLVDRQGGIITAEELLSLMWEDRPHDDNSLSLCRKAAYRLRRTLEEAGIAELLAEEKNGRRIRPELVECDYYRFLAGDEAARRQFGGIYMANYSWGETTLAALERMSGTFSRSD
ncbi:MAG: response regulator [Syntrophomonadaceae bacterium]|nr:response regulator [Syntrophomonadaceae bacterium]